MSTTPEEILTGFARVLRGAGLPVTMAATHTFLEAVSRLDLADPRDVYWAGRAVFCTRSTHIATYDYAFRTWFTDAPLPAATQVRPTITTGYEAGLDGGPGGEQRAEELPLAAFASAVEVLRHRDVATLTAAEQRILARHFAELPVPAPSRTTRRLERANHGVVDRVRTVRDQRRRGGEPGPLRYARRRKQPRTIIFLIDVSGSMKPYADALLRLAHHVCSQIPKAEAFAIGTRLTRITRALQYPDAGAALAHAGQVIPDWAGGTRLADNLREFLATWGRRGLARGAVVVVASDGWERGDAGEVGRQMRFLRALARRVIWSNPHAGKTGYEPVQGGIAAALPHLDALIAGHSFAAFENILRAIDGGSGAGSYAEGNLGEGRYARRA